MRWRLMSPSNFSILVQAIQNVSQNHEFRNRWVCQSSLMKAMTGKFVFHTEVNARTFSRAFSKISPSCDNLSLKNAVGYFRAKKGQERFIFFQEKYHQPPILPNFLKDKEKKEWDQIVRIDNEKLLLFLENIKKEQERSERPKKRKKIDDIQLSLDIKNQLKNATNNVSIGISYWDSLNAKNLFNPLATETVLKCLMRRDRQLLSSTTDDKDLFDQTHDNSELGSLTVKARKIIRLKCMYLRKAYEIAIQHMNQKTWGECCTLAVAELKDVGIDYITQGRTIQNWNMEYRKTELFEIPNAKMNREPKLFSLFPEAKEELLEYCNTQAAAGALNSEIVASEIRNHTIQNCYKKLVDALETNESIPTIEEFKSMVDLKNVTVSTSWRWLQSYGFTYSDQKKCYFTDGHEREDVVKDRNNRFLLNYFRYELRSMRWIQITETLAKEIENETPSFPKDCFYEYDDESCGIMREYHIDTNNILENYVPAADKKYGGSKSVRNLGKALMIIGQDESTYHQYIFSKKQWKTPSGAEPLLPKSVGEMYMVSGFQSRTFGLGNKQNLTEETIERINEKRKNKLYESKIDATILNGSDKKNDLSDDPTLRFFRAGANYDGYWVSPHIKLQTEDVCDVLVHLYPEFDFVFLFDQSSGHTKKRSDALNAEKMNVSFGGKNKTRDTTVQEVGTYHPTLQVGSVQKMHFVNQDEGPFWLTEQQRQQQKYNQPLGTQTEKEKTKAELLVDVRMSGFDTSKRRYLKKELQEICTARNIPLTLVAGDFIPGWMGQEKGMLQVLFERGYIDITKVKSARSGRYSKLGKKGDFEFGELTAEGKKYALKHIINECSDFLQEKTDLEHLLEEISTDINTFSVLYTPKFHCELAGEGIEYSWGVSKKIYRKKTFQEKRSFESFVRLVKESLDRVTVEMARKFSKKARRYMLGYYHQWKESTLAVSDRFDMEGFDEKPSFVKNESVHKLYKSHRDVSSAASAFISSVMSECIRL